MAFLIKGLLGLILVIAYLLVSIGGLWVLRIAVDWFWDFDYVKWLKGKAKDEDRQ